QLVAPPDPGDDGAGHRPRSPHRRVALDWCRAGPGRDLLRERAAIERRFGNLTSFAGGPGPLPGWVRRRGRVERWVWCKLAVNAARITRNQRQQMGQMQ
ncbi:MAG: hypothetical protein K2X82_21995, partial [Gemmataceae bacterium]|nr:hypothetical protein [Gemmataceae bacterium]